MLISPNTRKLTFERYKLIPKVVGSIDPKQMGSILSKFKSTCTFFPSVGMFSTEIALGYCYLMNNKQGNGEPGVQKRTKLAKK